MRADPASPNPASAFPDPSNIPNRLFPVIGWLIFDLK
jgi:hypothetical protein